MQRTRFYRKVLVVDAEPDVRRSVYDPLRIDYEVVTCQRSSRGARPPQGRHRRRRDLVGPENARNDRG